MKVDIKKVVEEASTIKNKIETLEEMLQKKKKILQAYMEKTGNTCRGNGISCYIQERVTVEYDKEKLKETLDKKKYNEIIDKEYKITDFDMFKSILRRNNIDLKEFKQCIKKEEDVNESKINKLFENGLITLEDISGCYTAKGKKSVVIKKDKHEEVIDVNNG